MAGSLKIAGLPIKARLYTRDFWTVRAAEDGEETTFTVAGAEVGTEVSINVWAVRERFLGLNGSKQVTAFLKRCGPLQSEPRVSKASTTEVTLSTIRQYQGWFRDFIRQETPKWKNFHMPGRDFRENLARNLALNYTSPVFKLEMGHATVKGLKVPAPYLNLEAFDVSEAVYASIYLDKMRGLRGGVCEREGCNNTFLTTDPRKRFCDVIPGRTDCGAVVRMRESRRSRRERELSNGEA